MYFANVKDEWKMFLMYTKNVQMCMGKVDIKTYVNHVLLKDVHGV